MTSIRKFILPLAVLALAQVASATTINLSTGAATYSGSYSTTGFGVGDAPMSITTLSNPGSFPGGWQNLGVAWLIPGSGYDYLNAGFYSYSTSFTLHSAGTLTGEFSSDDSGPTSSTASAVYVTGGSLSSPLLLAQIEGSNVYYAISTFSPAELGPGSYTLIGDSYNTNGPSGITINASVSTATPEPGSLALLGTGVLGVGAALRRRMGLAARG